MTSSRRNLCAAVLCAAAVLNSLAGLAHATGVPIGGFLPLVGIGLTDEFYDDFTFSPEHRDGVTGTLLGLGGVPHYDVALLDTGAAVSLLTHQAFNDFALGSASPGEPDGYRGTETIGIGGATGTLVADINDPFGLYATGLQHRTGLNGSPLTMDDAALQGQINTSVITLPAESELPNVLGLSYASQYATHIRSDQPQIFTLDGKTVRTPSIEFLERGSGGQGITRRAPLSLNPSESFSNPPAYLLNIGNLDVDNPQENPSLPTIIQGGLFLNVNLANSGATLTNSSFFFDTGADVSVLSELTALQLGIDVVLDEPDFTVAILGSGGAKEDVPGYYLDQFTIQALGGSVVANNVPVLVLDVADPSNPANTVPGIVGTNLLAGRNLVIDPNPSLSGGASPSLYISDPVTTQHNWATTASSASWTGSGSWNSVVPGELGIANVRNVAPTGDQVANLNANATVWEVNVSGAPGRTMTLQVGPDRKLTTFAGVNIEESGVIDMRFSSLDTQYMEILGGTLSGWGVIATGSGPVSGQVENRSGTVSPGLPFRSKRVGTLYIVGRFVNGSDGVIDIDISGTDTSAFDRLLVDGPVTLDGTLNVVIREEHDGRFVPSFGNIFSIVTADRISGAFSSLDLPTLTDDKMWAVTYEPTEVLLKITIPGDFNGDFTVDGADLDTWRDGFGTLFSGASFLDWQRNLGMSLSLAAAVPEPNALALAGIAAMILFRRRSSGLLARG